MGENTLRRFKARVLLTSRFVWHRKGLWLRAALCWLVGMTFTLADREHDYDTRLQLRGSQPTDSRIVIVKITPEEWRRWLLQNGSELPPVSDSTFIADSFFWNIQAWHKILSQTLDEKPLAIGVSTYFGENIPPSLDMIKQSSVFSDTRVVWSTQLNDEGRLLKSWFGSPRRITLGLNEHFIDGDGVVRRISTAREQLPLFATQLLRHDPQFLQLHGRRITVGDSVINFRGRTNTFTNISFGDFISKNYPLQFLKGKIVLVGSADVEGSFYQTPIGKMTRDEISATIIDNIQNKRWIHRPSLYLIGFIFFIFVFATAWVTSNYPQFFAIFIIACFNIFYSSLSLWVFDALYIWTPIFATALVSLVTYITFLSFQLTLKEYMNVQLENERQFLFEVEQLKNNFLSLISHDLKTPIAKIQGICDRLITEYPEREFTGDLSSLRAVASELHRYIRTILEITRVESRNFSINKDSADMNEIIEAVVNQLEPLALNKRIMITKQLEPMFLIEVDQILVHEVVLNLIENAIKYTPEGGTVKVSSREVDDRVLVMVEDSGPGIPPNEQMRIFEKFYRGELGKTQSKGSGLGLYLVKYFVELHEGRVFLESTMGHGTRVGFSLPLGESGGVLTTTEKAEWFDEPRSSLSDLPAVNLQSNQGGKNEIQS